MLRIWSIQSAPIILDLPADGESRYEIRVHYRPALSACTGWQPGLHLRTLKIRSSSMVMSMTAFARKQQEYPWGSLIWEIRSVNHRYLEPGLRLPDALRALEPALRDSLRKALGRGKVECQLRFQANERSVEDISVNTALVEQLSNTAQMIAELTNLSSAPLSVAEILKWPGVMQEANLDFDATSKQAATLFQETLSNLNEARAREGAELATLISKRLQQVREIVDSVRSRMPEILKRQQELISNRLQDFKAELDPARLEQELVILAQKSDVDEELDRLSTHIDEVARVLRLSEPIGRRLDFLMQELNREANTLSSKSIVAETTLDAVELKVLIEQMREQVQNIE